MLIDDTALRPHKTHFNTNTDDIQGMLLGKHDHSAQMEN